MELQVTITLSERLFGLLEDKLPSLGRRVEKAVTKELTAQARQEANVQVSVSAGGKAPETAPKATTPEASAPEASQTVEKVYTEVDVRDAIDRTRLRIEGEDYENKSGSEGYRRWHSVLTGWFRNTAGIYGAEKPSALRDSESRRKFIAECDALQVVDDELQTPAPF